MSFDLRVLSVLRWVVTVPTVIVILALFCVDAWDGVWGRGQYDVPLPIVGLLALILGGFWQQPIREKAAEFLQKYGGTGGTGGTGAPKQPPVAGPGGAPPPAGPAPTVQQAATPEWPPKLK